MPLADIEPQAKARQQAYQLLTERVQAMEMGLQALRNEHLPGVKRALAKVAEIDSQLKPLIEANRDEFVRPKTVVMHGQQVGFEKGKGKISFDKPAKVVERIKRLMPEQADLLIHKEEKPNKKTLIKLPVQELKRLGCELTGTGDQVVLRSVDSEVDKLVSALLKSATDAASEDEEGEQ